jgi:pimeloyl-ACP methyl ester carboxylesterase
MKKINVPGGGAVTIFGDLNLKEIPLILLHGFCEDSRLWNGLLPLLKDIPILLIDLPGSGSSDPLPFPGMWHHAQAVEAALSECGIDRYVLAGHSMGGYVTLEFARQFPENLAGFGLIHSHPFADSPERIEIRKRGIEMLRSGKRDLYVAQLFPNLFAPHFAAAHPEILQNMIRTGQEQSPEGIISALESMMNRTDHMDTLQQTALPALFLLGSEDSLIPTETGLKAAAATRISSTHVLPGVGHMGMLEAPEQTAEILLGFYHFALQV